MRTAHILVVDDDPSNLDVLQLVLEHGGGYRVTTAQCVCEDLAEVRRLQPDLIVVDLKMGSYERGWSFLQDLASSHLTNAIPLVLCTAALSEVRARESFLVQQGIPVIQKPFEVDEVLAVVRNLLAPCVSSSF